MERGKDTRFQEGATWVAQTISKEACPPISPTILVSDEGKVLPGLPDPIYHGLNKAARIVSGFQSGDLGPVLRNLRHEVAHTVIVTNKTVKEEFMQQLDADTAADIKYYMNDMKMTFDEALYYVGMRKEYEKKL